jgi:hypothetical protein
MVKREMFDKFTEKMMENALSGSIPRLEELSRMRVDELAAVKAKVRTRPEEVEAWFDTEITKASNMDVSGILKKMIL